MKIAVIDGQGGGIGRAVVDRLRDTLGEDVYIIALGTNALATAAMLKAGANEGATGENAIVVNVEKVDIIVGSVAILAVNAMTGELTQQMAAAIGKSEAKKILIPLNKCNIVLAGVENKPLPHYIDDVIQYIASIRDDYRK
jgi:NAD(P)-dependent dehydrogenase (short-subunit alcohol dehydrogenase family)